jgi:hypothetical protein
MFYRDEQSPIDRIRETQRQAEIRELYSKVNGLENYIATNLQVAAEAPQPVVLSSVINYLENSDFKLSVKEYDPETTIATPCDVLDKWYQSSSLAYTTHDYASTSPSTNAITLTSSNVKWDPYNGMLVMNGGSRFATPLLDRFASSGNILYFRTQFVHYPVRLGVIRYTDEGLFTIGYSVVSPEPSPIEGYLTIKNGQIVNFPTISISPEIGSYASPDTVGFFEPLTVSDLTTVADQETISGVTYQLFTLKLKRFGTDSYITGVGDYTADSSLTLPKTYVGLWSRIHPNTEIRITILEDVSGTLKVLTQQQGVAQNTTDNKAAELVLSNRLQNFYQSTPTTWSINEATGQVNIAYNSFEISGALSVPELENPLNRGSQWMEVRFLVGGNSVTDIHIPAGTVFLDKIALSSSFGSWSPSARDSILSLVCSRTAPGDVTPIIGGGGGGTVALPPPPDGGGIETGPTVIPSIPPSTRGGTF